MTFKEIEKEIELIRSCLLEKEKQIQQKRSEFEYDDELGSRITKHRFTL